MKARFNILLGTLVVVVTTQAVNATDYTWIGSTSGTWDTSGTNWSGSPTDPWNSTNGLTNKAIFNLPSLDAIVSGSIYTNGITFSTTGALSGGTISLTGTTPTISVAASQTGSISSTISGTAGLTKASTGTLILSGANDYTGGTAINDGTIQINAGGTLGSTSGSLSMGTGSSGILGTVGNLTVNADTQVGAFSVKSNTANTSGANIGQLTIASGKTLTVSSLSIGVSQGATGNAVNTALGSGTSNTGTLTVTNDVTVGLSDLGTGSFATTVADLSGLANFNAGSGTGNFRVGYGRLNKATMTLASTANTINVATISVGETINNGNSAQNNILNLGAGTNALQATTLRIGTQKASGVIQFAGSTGSVVISGPGGTGTANIILGDHNSSGGYQPGNLGNGLLLAGHTATVNAGSVTISRKPSTGSGNVTSSITFDTGTFNASSISTAVVSSGSATPASSATGTFTLGTDSSSSGILTLTGNFALGSNTSTATAAVSTFGNFIINGGTASIGGNITDTSTTTTGSSTTTLTLNGGTLDMTNGNIGGDGTSGNRAITNLNFQSGTLKNVAQINGGNTGLTKTTTGTLILGGTNSYTGATLISQGTLQIGEGSTTGTLSTSSTITNNGTLAFRRSNTITQGTNFANGISGSGGIAVKSTSSSGVVVLGGTNTFAGGIAIASGVLKITSSTALGTGTKQVTLSGGAGEAANLAFQIDGGSGNITIPSSVSFLSSSNSGAGIRNIAGNNEIQGSIGLNTGLSNSTIGSDAGTLTVSGNISTTNANRTLQLNGESTNSNTISGIISDGTGGVSLSKTGNGTWLLSNSNSYDGTTSISGGKLIINGDQSTANGAVTVSGANTRLAGVGTIGGNTTIQTSAIHSPGNSPGVQSFTGDLTYSDGSIFEWDIDRTAAQTRGTGYDGVNVSGALAGADGVDEGVTTDAVFRVVISDSDFSNTFWDTTRSWTNIFTDADGTTAKTNWAGIFGGGFEYFYNDGTTLTSISPTGQGSFSFTGLNNNELTWTAVPEPSSALVGLLITAGLLRRRRA